MKAADLRQQSVEELEQLRRDSEHELAEMRLRHGAGDGAEQPLRLRTLRREIARIKTVLRERRLSENG